MLWFWKNKIKFLTLFLLLIAAIPSIIPLFHKGFFVTDDGEWMIIRFAAFYSALRDGQFPVRFLHTLNSGYGYPVGTFLYPGFMYFAIPIQIITSNFVDTIKIIFGLSLIGSTLFTYLWLSKFFSKTASVIGAIVSLYLPYHLYDIYTRGSVGEVLAFAWIPFIFWMIERKSIFYPAIGITFLILSHNTIAALFLPIIIFYLALKIYSDRKKWPIHMQAFMLAAGIGMAVFFIGPAFFELQLTKFTQVKVSNPFSYFADINLIGPVSIFIFIIAIVTYLFKRNKIKNYKNILIMFFIITAISLFLSTSYSTDIWKITSTSWIQFPFRILSILIFSISFLTAFVLTEIKGTMRTFLLFLIIILLVMSALPFSTPKEFLDKGESFYYTNAATTTVQDEYMPVWVKQKYLQMPENKVDIINGQGSVRDILYNNKQISFSADIGKNAFIQVNTIYWPGWNAYVDEKLVPISYDNPKGVMRLNVSSGNHLIKLKFSETPPRLTSDALSLASLIIILFVCIKRRYEYF